MRNFVMQGIGACGLAAIAIAATVGARTGPAGGKETVTKVTLKRRGDNGPYGPSAYSFRCASQDLDVHRNRVDLVLNGCGRLHLSAYGGMKSRAVRVDAKELEDVKGLPEEGWSEDCIEPEDGAVHVLDIHDETDGTRMKVKFVLTDVSEKEVKLEWAPFVDGKRGQSGTMGQCGGTHGCP